MGMPDLPSGTFAWEAHVCGKGGLAPLCTVDGFRLRVSLGARDTVNLVC